jgi:hypothetical protein
LRIQTPEKSATQCHGVPLCRNWGEFRKSQAPKEIRPRRRANKMSRSAECHRFTDHPAQKFGRGSHVRSMRSMRSMACDGRKSVASEKQRNRRSVARPNIREERTMRSPGIRIANPMTKWHKNSRLECQIVPLFGPGSMPGNTCGRLTRSASEGDRNPHLRFGLVRSRGCVLTVLPKNPNA